MDIESKYIIDYQGLSLGEHHFAMEIDDAFFTLWPESEVHSGTAIAKIDMVKHSSMMELEIDIKGQVEVECDRCLDPVRLPIHFQGEVIVKISQDMGEDDGDIIWLHPSDTKLNLSQYLYESIILSLPYQRVHELLEQCNQDMLRRFKIVTPEEFEQIETQLEGNDLVKEIKKLNK